MFGSTFLFNKDSYYENLDGDANLWSFSFVGNLFVRSHLISYEFTSHMYVPISIANKSHG
jgi:hypothetical protein